MYRLLLTLTFLALSGCLEGVMTPLGLSSGGSVTPPEPELGTTYYVRTDGGNANQCNGTADVAYPGSGTNQDCAWNKPSIALPATGSSLIDAGDRLIIGGGNYTITSEIKIPSGISDTHRTRVLGKSCTSVPKLVGSAGVVFLINLSGTSNVELGCLELTDDSDCIRQYYTTGTCGGSEGARYGIHADTSHDVWLHHLNVHGFAHTGLYAGNLSDWTLDHVKLNKNGRSGWNGLPSAPNSGDIILRNVEVSWNGCGERVATGEAWGCWGQTNGGYGDGIGLSDTGGRWLLEDVHVHHNTSDGIDMLYMDGDATTHVTLRRVRAENNAGNQAKISGNSLIENSVFVGYCTYFDGKYSSMDGLYNSGSGDHCRAYGATVLLNFRGDNTVIVRHNTITGEGEGLLVFANQYGDSNSSDQVYILNNLGVGFPYYLNSSSKAFVAGNFIGTESYSGNFAWNVSACPSGTTCNTQTPSLTNMTLASFNGLPMAGSPVVNTAPAISAVTTDILKNPRPVGSGPDIGAYEVQ